MSDVDLERYRRRAEEFVGALDLEYYEHFSGRKARCDTAAVYDRYPELFTREAIDGLEELYAVARDDAKWRLAYLLAFAVDGYLGEQTKHLGDEIANTEGETSITVDGEPIGLRQASVVQGNEPDRARRERIQAARLAATAERLNPLLDAMWRRCHDLAVELGYPDYKELYGTVKGLDYDHLRAELEAFLADTEGLYERVMDRLVRERLGVPLAQLSYADLPYLWRAEGFDHAFGADALLPSLRRTLAGMGIDLDAQSNVHLDTEVRALKSPRAFCAPVRVPDEIYLCVLPQGGQDDFGMLFHEAGHTEHFAHVLPDLAFEYRHLGDNAVTEGFAFIFDHLIGDREWLRQILDYEDADEYVRFAAVNDLYFMRRYAGKLSYEVQLHAQNGPLDDMAGRVQSQAERGHQGGGARGELPGRRRRGLLLRELPARVDARGRAARHAAGRLRPGLVHLDRGRGLAQGPVVAGAAAPRRAAAAEAGRRASQRRPVQAPPRAGARALRPGSRPRGSGGQERHEHPPVAGPVELGEVDALPGAQLQGAAHDRHEHAAAHEARLGVCVGVPLEVREGQVAGHEALERHGEVGAHGRVGVLVDGHAGRGVRHEDQHGAVAGVTHETGDVTGDVDEAPLARSS